MSTYLQVRSSRPTFCTFPKLRCITSALTPLIRVHQGSKKWLFACQVCTRGVNQHQITKCERGPLHYLVLESQAASRSRWWCWFQDAKQHPHSCPPLTWWEKATQRKKCTTVFLPQVKRFAPWCHSAANDRRKEGGKKSIASACRESLTTSKLNRTFPINGSSVT